MNTPMTPVAPNSKPCLPVLVLAGSHARRRSAGRFAAAPPPAEGGAA